MQMAPLVPLLNNLSSFKILPALVASSPNSIASSSYDSSRVRGVLYKYFYAQGCIIGPRGRGMMGFHSSI